MPLLNWERETEVWSNKYSKYQIKDRKAWKENLSTYKVAIEAFAELKNARSVRHRARDVERFAAWNTQNVFYIDWCSILGKELQIHFFFYW